MAKEKKPITEDDIEILMKHINTTKLRLIDTQNEFSKSIGTLKGAIILLLLILVIIAILSYII